MSENLKKVLMIVGFAVAVFGLAFLLYYFFFRPAPQPSLPAVNIQPQTTGQLPQVGEGPAGAIINLNVNGRLPTISQLPAEIVVSPVARGGLTEVKKLNSQNISQPSVSANGQVSYYNTADGRFYRINADGSVTLLSDQRFYQVENITWSGDSSKAVLEYPDGSNIVYDFNAKKQYSLPKEMQDFAFAGDNNKLAAEVIGPSDENNWLVSLNADGSNIRFVERLGDQADNVDLNWSPDSQVVALFRKNSGSNSQDIILIGQNDENFRALPVYGRGFEGNWTPNGQQLLYSVYPAENGFKPTLWLASAKGESIGLANTPLALETWSYKCAVAADNATAYCGVPQELPNGSGVYPELAAEVNDNFYKIDLRTGQKSLLAQPIGDQGGYSVKRIFLGEGGRNLYFEDAFSGGVYNLKLE